jgi:hypothetical protein
MAEVKLNVQILVRDGDWHTLADRQVVIEARIPELQAAVKSGVLQMAASSALELAEKELKATHEEAA